jgi:SAM-dependent methyltransferase
VVKKHFGGSYVGKVAYELSTYGSTLKWLERSFPEVITSEFIPSQPLGQYVKRVLNQDVQRLTFDSESIDLVTSNQVFEHVPDDLQGFKECLRVLKRGGAMVMSIPLYPISSTQRIATVVNSEIVFLGVPEYHDSRIAGAQSAPVFWHHSVSDIAMRVKDVGFSSVELINITLTRHQKIPTKIVYAVK